MLLPPQAQDSIRDTVGSAFPWGLSPPIIMHLVAHRKLFSIYTVNAPGIYPGKRKKTVLPENQEWIYTIISGNLLFVFKMILSNIFTFFNQLKILWKNYAKWIKIFLTANSGRKAAYLNIGMELTPWRFSASECATLKSGLCSLIGGAAHPGR